MNACLVFLELKSNVKEITTNGRTHLFISIKFIKKNSRKKTVKLQMKKKMSIAME